MIYFVIKSKLGSPGVEGMTQSVRAFLELMRV